MPLLQTVYQADAAHMNFGKYTLCSCYGIPANCNAFPVAFGIIFGNEDKERWDYFSKFVKSCHPSINHAWVTVITNQQKGSVEALQVIVPLAVNSFAHIIGERTFLHMSRVEMGNTAVFGTIIFSLDVGRLKQ